MTLSDKEAVLNAIKVFPNPSAGTFEISGIAGKSFELTVFNMVGQKILSLENETKFDLSNFANGNYIVKVSSGSQMVTKKLSLNH